MSKENWFENMHDDLWLKDDTIGYEESETLKKVLKLRAGYKVLDIPCGAGRIAVHLAKSGVKMTCIDLRQIFIQRARKRFIKNDIQGTFIAEDMRRISFSNEFDAVYNWMGSFGYFNDKENQAILKLFCEASRKKGRIAIDQIHREKVLRNFKKQSEIRGIKTRTKYDRETQTLITQRKVGDNPWGNLSVIRVYTYREMETLFELAGLRVIQVLGSHSGERFTRTSRRMIFIGEKI